MVATCFLTMSKVTSKVDDLDHESDTLTAFCCVKGDIDDDDECRFDRRRPFVVVSISIDVVDSDSGSVFVFVIIIVIIIVDVVGAVVGIVSVLVVVVVVPVPITRVLMKIAVVTVINSSAGGLILAMFGSTLYRQFLVLLALLPKAAATSSVVIMKLSSQELAGVVTVTVGLDL
jgi:hypothetical protein